MESSNARAVAPAMHTGFDDLYGHAPAFRRAVAMARKAAATDCSVLIVGETGTGKELIARAIHESSARHAQPWVAINCGAISRELIGSELFGHTRGSFTGATMDRDGVFEQAHTGTLFLDELGELPMEQQTHLLRVLETRMVRRLGGNSERAVDVRVVAATNRLAHLGTERSAMRLDLFHRVATVVIHLPPLRERAEDIPLLVRRFLDEFSSSGSHTIARETVQALTEYSWPGNVRELRQAVMRAVALCSDELTLEHLLPRSSQIGYRTENGRGLSARAASSRRPIVRVEPSSSDELRPIDVIIRNALLDALSTHTSVRSAARSLGMAKSTFADWARRLGITIE